MTVRRAAVIVALGIAGLAAWLVVPAITSTGPRENLPAQYAGRTNPLLADAGAAVRGAEIFHSTCATCHGERADGRGPAAAGLTPPPANFRSGDVLVQHSDAYLYYRVSTGKPGTAMPSFHGVLDEGERWAVVTYLRTLQPGR